VFTLVAVLQLEVQRSPEWRRLIDAVVAEERGGNGTQEVHPKLVKLKEVLVEHFDRHNAGDSSTRAIVFTQYRHSVEEVSLDSLQLLTACTC
jgi:ERCC4-related helicase